MHRTSEIQVLLPLQNGQTIFDYKLIPDLCVEIGDFVEVEFRRKKIIGIVWNLIKSHLEQAKLKPIIGKFDLPKISTPQIQLIKFIAEYNLAEYGSVLKMMMPIQSSFTVKHENTVEKKYLSKLPRYTEEQQRAIDQISATNTYQVTLLDGVTGAGKTEVYFALVAKTLLQSTAQTLILLPEIMLTTQLIARVEKTFGVKPATWHSDMTLAQKKRLWLDIMSGKERLVIGARSALFLPYKDLKLIIVDEEHDQSYKQEEGVVYNARDASVACGYIYNIPVILASATPSIESLTNVQLGKYQHVTLSSRYGADAMPEIKVVDMRTENLQKNHWLSYSLIAEIKNTLAAQKQTMLFLNRRGYAPITLCKSCGHKYHCPDCSSHLVSHFEQAKLLCHHCGYSIKLPSQCINCKQENSLIQCGPGVERIAEEVRNIFPDANLKIVTRDTVQNIDDAQQTINAIYNKEIDIIIGTQMISKGHDFPDITLVGIIDADLGLTSADLRSAEKTYHLLTQMSGRAGRRGSGIAVIQTYYPDSPILDSMIKNDRTNFINYEMQNRKILAMPPYGRLAAIIVSGTNDDKLKLFLEQMRKAAPRVEDIMVLGPVKAPLAKIRKHYRYRFLIKTSAKIKIQKFIQTWLAQIKIPSNIRIKIDIDPYNFL